MKEKQIDTFAEFLTLQDRLLDAQALLIQKQNTFAQALLTYIPGKNLSILVELIKSIEQADARVHELTQQQEEFFAELTQIPAIAKILEQLEEVSEW